MTENLKKILIQNDLEKYAEIFEKEKIETKEDLSKYTVVDYEKLGITNQKDCQKLVSLFFIDLVANSKKSSGIKKQKKSAKSIFWGIVAALLIGTGSIVGFVLGGNKTENHKASSLSVHQVNEETSEQKSVQEQEFEDDDETSSNQKFGSNNIDDPEESNILTPEVMAQLDPSGKIQPSEKESNRIALDKKKKNGINEKDEVSDDKQSGSNESDNTGNKKSDVCFEDDDELFEEKQFGSDSVKKVYEVAEDFSVFNAVSGVDLDGMSQDAVENIVMQKSRSLGRVIYPYGFPRVSNMNEENISIEIAIRELLCQIPFDMLPKARFLLEGHTDTIYNPGESADLTNPIVHEFNQKLSERRAEYAKKIMISYGISPSAITTVGYSYDQTIFSPDDINHPENPNENRRVEVKVLF